MKNLIDIHSHIVPGVDDGSKSPEESLKILKASYEGGVRKMILTPHFRLGMFETDGETILNRFRHLKDEAEKQFPELSLYLGCEFHASMDMEELLKTHPRFFMAGSRYLLLEFSSGDTESFIKDRVYAAESLGAKVILAHVERYQATRKPEFLEELKRRGAMIQVNADAVLGKDGFLIKRYANKLIKDGLIDIIASDAHDLSSRATHLCECAKYVERKYGTDTATELFYTNPNKILDNQGQNSI